LVVLTYAAKDDAVAVIERIRKELDRTLFTFGGVHCQSDRELWLADSNGTRNRPFFSKLQALADEAL